jgi:hypothetical protein
MHHISLRKPPGGRPPKFNEPSKPVTITLPERTLARLRSIDRDRAKAVVKAVDAVFEDKAADSHGAQVIEMAPGTGIVVIPDNRSLRSVTWFKMIEVAPARYLLSIAPGTSIEKIEIALMDLVEKARASAPEDVGLLETLRGQLGELRRGQKISMAEILFVDV